MRKHVNGAEIATFLVSHAVAAGVYAVVFLVLPAVLIALIVLVLIVAGLITGDPGGPLWLPATVAAGLTYAIAVSILGVVAFLTACLLRLVRRYFDIPFAAALIILFPAVYSLLGWFGIENPWFRLAAGAPLFVYWLTLSASESVMIWLGRRFARLRRVSA